MSKKNYYDTLPGHGPLLCRRPINDKHGCVVKAEACVIEPGRSE